MCGGHINPAVTIGHAFLGKLGPTFMANFITSLWIIASQFLGGFVASALVHTLYADAESVGLEFSFIVLECLITI